MNQQTFAGARASGTNDKAGSKLILYRWALVRTIKENFNPLSCGRLTFLSPNCKPMLNSKVKNATFD
ncbi:MAG: hypothetical protein H0X62_13760 [Bacteroidetes bacterium]|nr:hypothetical protein [Bacteroidota bacterium]